MTILLIGLVMMLVVVVAVRLLARDEVRHLVLKRRGLDIVLSLGLTSMIVTGAALAIAGGSGVWSPPQETTTQ